MKDFANDESSEESLSQNYGIKSTSDFNITKAQSAISEMDLNEEIIKCSYRPFEEKFILFDRVVVDRPRKELITHSKNKKNILLGIGRQGLAVGNIQWCLTTIAKHPVDANMFRRGGVNLFPLYLYPETTDQQSTETPAKRVPNLDPKILAKIEKSLGLNFVPEKNSPPSEGPGEEFAPIDLLDYIYAVLHSPTYRETYKEFLKIDFPRVPYPENQKQFWQLVELGGELRKIHLLESPKTEEYITNYPVDGDNVITRKITKTSPGFEITNADEKVGRVWINDVQYFDNVPEVAWEFYIGGYQPAQKWLKDRKGRELKFEDILHYQKIIVALTETDRLMKEIDGIEFIKE